MDERIQSFVTYLTTVKGFSRNTTEAYGNDLVQMADELRSVRSLNGSTLDWRTVDRAMLTGYTVHLREKGNGGRPYAPATVARKIAAIKSFFSFICGSHVGPLFRVTLCCSSL